jgi:hypothetical protein
MGQAEHWLRVFEERVLRKMFCPEREEVTQGRRNFIMSSFLNFIPRKILLG